MQTVSSETAPYKFEQRRNSAVPRIGETATSTPPGALSTNVDPEAFANDQIVYESARSVRPAQPKLPLDQRLAKIRGVVLHCQDMTVTISCQLPQDQTDISVPADLVPRSCLRYGAPVWVSVDDDNGYKRLSIQKRTDIVKQPAPRDLDELNEWLLGED